MRNKIVSLVLGCLFVSFLFSCKESKQREIERLMKEWYGKELFFPKGLTATVMGDSNVVYSDPSYVNTTWKIVFYADSLGCVSCDLNLLEWMDFMEIADSITGKNVSFFFYFAPKKEKEIISTLRLEKFNVPVFIDYRRKFDELNRLPENQLFRTFLLHENNKIRLIGNPIHGMEKLYLKVLDKQYREDD